MGDRIVVTIDGNEQTRLITAVVPGTGSGKDQLAIDKVFSTTTALNDAKYYISKRVLNVDHSQLAIGGTSGAKSLSLTSLDNSAVFSMTAAGTEKPALLTVSSDDISMLQVYGGSHEDVKLKLEDKANRNGYVFTRGDGANNELELERMYAGPGLISVSKTSQWVTASADNLFNAANMELGDAISLSVDGLEEVRTIIEFNRAANPDKLKVSSMFTGQTNIVKSVYQVAKRVMTVESDDVVVFGGSRGGVNSGKKELILQSSDSTAALTVEGLGSRAELNMRAGDDGHMRLVCGAKREAALVLRDADNHGFKMSRASVRNP